MTAATPSPSPAAAEYAVTGMSCGHCERAIRQELDGVPDLTAVDVSAATGRLRIESAGPIDDAAILAAVDEAGYTATRA